MNIYKRHLATYHNDNLNHSRAQAGITQGGPKSKQRICQVSGLIQN